MPDIFVDPTGSNTAPYDTLAKAANEVQTAFLHFGNSGTGVSTIKITPAIYLTPVTDAPLVAALPFDLTIQGTSLTNLPTVPGFLHSLNPSTVKLTIKSIKFTATLDIQEILDDITIENVDVIGARLRINTQSGKTETIKNVLIVNDTDALGSFVIVAGGAAGLATNIENLTIDNCTKGIFIEFPGVVNLKNSIISNCTTAVIINDSGDTFNSSFTTYFGNTTDVDNSAGGTFTSSNDYRSGGAFEPLNPEFVATPDNFRLRATSSAIDAGDPTSSFSNEPKPNGNRVNLGRYGNTSEATITLVFVGYGHDYGNHYGGYRSNVSFG